jgi:ankyrin repeat protein
VNAAAAAHDHETMRLLLEAGADPDAQQKGGFTPLHEAAHSDDVEMARLLLEHEADPGIEADDGRDSAKLAADDGSTGVEALLEG